MSENTNKTVSPADYFTEVTVMDYIEHFGRYDLNLKGYL